MATQNSTRMTYSYTIAVTLKTFNGIFKPSVERFEFSFCAGSRDEAISLASANVKSQGYLHDEKQVEVLEALPISVAAERALLEQISELRRQTDLTLQSVRQATRVVRELTRSLEAV